MKVELHLVNAEVLTVAEDETLIVKLPSTLEPWAMQEIYKEFANAGIPGNRLIIVTGEAELTKVKRT